MIFLAIFSVALLTGAGCGQIRLGSGTPNDAVPTGTYLVGGPFTGLNSASVTGAASVYSSGDGSYTLRLEGVSFPNVGGGLYIVVTINGAAQTPIALRSLTGSQNYSISGPTSAAFSMIRIRSGSLVDYAIANLI